MNISLNTNTRLTKSEWAKIDDWQRKVDTLKAFLNSETASLSIKDRYSDPAGRAMWDTYELEISKGCRDSVLVTAITELQMKILAVLENSGQL